MIPILAQLSARERVNAVHETFANRTLEDAQVPLFWMFVACTLLLAILAVSHRLQVRRQKREAKQRQAELANELGSRGNEEKPGNRSQLPAFGSNRPSVVGHRIATDPPEGAALFRDRGAGR